MKYESLIPMSNSLEYYLPAPLSDSRSLAASPDRGRLIHSAFRAGLVGCPVDVETAPYWARKVARYARDELKANLRCEWYAEAAIPSQLHGVGRGRRAVHFQHAMNLDAKILAGAQNYNNCAAWTGREGAGCCIAVDKIERGEAHAYEARPGTAVTYSFRGSRTDSGMTLSDVVRVLHTIGISLEKAYLDGRYDLSTEAADEAAGVRWGRNGAPQDLLEVIKGDLIEQVSNVQEETAVLDILHLGHFIITGSTLTAEGPGDPVSKAGPIGAHAQLLMGYDDTDEFRAWYRETTGKTLTDWVGIFDQSWPADWLQMANWPEHLWGPRPEGAFVLAGRDVMRMITEWGEAIAISKVKGFPQRNLPDWGSGLYL